MTMIMAGVGWWPWWCQGHSQDGMVAKAIPWLWPAQDGVVTMVVAMAKMRWRLWSCLGGDSGHGQDGMVTVVMAVVAMAKMGWRLWSCLG